MDGSIHGYKKETPDAGQENPEGYETSDPGTHLKGLKGRLLVVQGTRDDTVMWQNTISFIDKCVKAGVEVDYMVYPGQKHGLRGKSFAHFLRKLTRFFDEHLSRTRKAAVEKVGSAGAPR